MDPTPRELAEEATREIFAGKVVFGEHVTRVIEDAINVAVKAEREECASVAEKTQHLDRGDAATSIRARNTPDPDGDGKGKAKDD